MKSRARAGRLAASACLLGAGYVAGAATLDGDALRVFQRLMAVTAAGWVLTQVFADRLGAVSTRALARFDEWLRAHPARAVPLLVSLMIGYFCAWTAVTFARHYYFHSAYDLAIMNQVVWRTSEGHAFARSIEVTTDLGDHVRPYLAALSLAYLAVPSPYVLLAFQSLVLSLGAAPLYILARRRLHSPAAGLCVAFCLLAYPPLGFVNRFDFHVEVLSVPLLLAACERIDARDLRAASLFMALTLLCKENLGLTVAALGVAAALFHGHRRFGAAWAAGGVAYSAVALLVVIPAFRGEPSDTLARYHWMGDTPSGMIGAALTQPVAIAQTVFAPEHILTLLQLVAPLAFLPLAGAGALLPAAPTLLYNFLAEWPAQTTIYAHYMTPALPFMLVGAVAGLSRAGRVRGHPPVTGTGPSAAAPSGTPAAPALLLMVLATLASWTYQNPVMGHATVSIGTAPAIVPAGTGTAVPLVWPNDAAIREGLALVPPDAGLLTTTHYAPHLSQRAWIEMIPRVPVGALPRETDAIFVNVRDQRSWSCADYVETLSAAAEGGFGLVFHRDGVILLGRRQGDAARLAQLLRSWPGCG